jgi:Mrp family chromosome partitioning ATPase
VQSPSIVPAATPVTEAATTTIADVVASLQQSGEGGRAIAVIGAARDVGTTLTSIALARTLAAAARVVLVDLSFVSPNLDVISDNPSAPGIADLVRGTASFGDIISRDLASRVHLVSAGQVGGDVAGLLNSQMLWAAIGALGQSYEYLVLDAGSQSETVLAPVASVAPYAVLVGGAAAVNALGQLAAQVQSAGFGHVAVLTGPPPALEESAARSAA